MALPTPTAISVTKRYIAPGTRKFVWVPTIASKAAPTSVEITAGKDLTKEVADASGWTTTSNNVDVPDFGSRFTSKAPGMISADDSSLTFYQDNASTDVRTVLTQDLAGYIIIFPEGIATALTMDVFPVKISSVSKQQSNTDAAQMVISFAITSQPVPDLAIPTV